MLYALAGIQLYWFSPINTVETLDQYNIITGIGFGGGSICFFTGATLLLARQVSTLPLMIPCLRSSHANRTTNLNNSGCICFFTGATLLLARQVSTLHWQSNVAPGRTICMSVTVPTLLQRAHWPFLCDWWSH